MAANLAGCVLATWRACESPVTNMPDRRDDGNDEAQRRLVRATSWWRPRRRYQAAMPTTTKAPTAQAAAMVWR